MADGVNTAPDFPLELLVRQFEDAATESLTEREHAETCRDYYDGKQWDDDERKVLNARKQPVITDNRIKDKVEYLLGMERQTRTDPKAYPRNPQDAEASEVATDALRYVADCNHFPQVKSRVFENLLIEGMGGCEVIVEADPRGGNPKVVQRYIRWDRIYRDPHSLAPDFSDAEYLGIVLWMDLSRAKVRYPQHAEVFDRMILDVGPTGYGGETYDDKPSLWVDRSRKRVRILEHYFRHGSEWYRAVLTKGAFIEPPAPSAYVDEYGQTECPIVLQSLYVERNGQRYGVVRRYKDLQDEINKRRSKALHQVSVRQVVADQGAVVDVERARKELARPDGYVEVAPGMRFDVQDTGDVAAGQFNLLQDALAALATTGPNAALLGQSGSVSGRAKEIDAQGGAVQLGIQFDAGRFWQKRVNVATWNRIKQFWTAEQWVRVTDNEGAPKYVGLNVADPQTGQVQNPVGRLEVDIVIDEAPDVVTLQSEQWMQLTELASKGIPIPPDVLLNASSLRNKKELIDRMTNGGQMPPEVQQVLQAKQQEFAQAAEQIQAKEQELQQREVEASSAQTTMKAELAMLNARKIEINAMEKALSVHAEAAQAQVNVADMASKQTESVQSVLPALSQIIAEQAALQSQQSAQIADAMAAVAQALAAPKRVELNRGADGRPATATVTPLIQ